MFNTSVVMVAPVPFKSYC